MLPNFVIIGAQKSASSFLHLCLNDHPDIYLPDEEISFFESPDYEQSDVADLGDIFANRTERLLGIKRPSYIGKPEVPARVVSILPNAKLIAVLMNPIDRAMSAYYHNIAYGFIPAMRAERGMRKLISDTTFLQRYKRATEIIEFGLYYKYLSQYANYNEDGRLLVLLHEDIISDPLGSIRNAYRYLDVDDTFTPPSLNVHPQKVLYNITRLRFMRLRNRFLYSYNSDRTRLFQKKMTSRDVFINDKFVQFDRKFLSKIFHDRKPVLSAKFRNDLYGIFSSDIAALEDFLQKDLSLWKPNSQNHGVK